MVRKLCGDATLKNVVLVTNMWSEVSPEVGEKRENQLCSEFFKPILDKGALMVRHHNTAQSAHDIIRRMVANYPVVLRIQRELVDECRDIADTAAGEVVNQELLEQARRHQTELEAIGEEQVLKEQDERSMRELEVGRKLVEQMEGIMKRLEGQEVRMEEMERTEAKYKQQLADLTLRLQHTEMASAADRARLEQAEAEHNRQLADLTRRLQDEVSASLAYRTGLEQGMKDLQDRVATAITTPTLYVQTFFFPPAYGG